jgi:hypothetical protein
MNSRRHRFTAGARRNPPGGLFVGGSLEKAAAQAKPESEMSWALYVTLSPVWFDPGEVIRPDHTLLGALCDP